MGDDACPHREPSLEVLLARLLPRLKAILAHYRIPFEDAEDVVQDALVLLVRKAAELRDPEAYLVTTLRFRCRMYWRNRSRQRLQSMETELLEALAEPQPPEQQGAVLRHDLGRLLAALPPRPRSLVRLRYGLGYTAREVADRTGQAPDSVRQRSTYARSLFARQAARLDLP